MIQHTCQKYEIIFDEKTGKLRAKRNEVDWRDLTGDGMVLAMLQEIDTLKERIKSAMDVLMLSSIESSPEGLKDVCYGAFITLLGSE